MAERRERTTHKNLILQDLLILHSTYGHSEVHTCRTNTDREHSAIHEVHIHRADTELI